MNRASLKDKVFLWIAEALATLSTCRRLQVGCLLLRPDGSIAGGGYNGSLPGMPHCAPETCNPQGRCFNTRHAERSALDYSGESPIATAYVTHEPCLACTRDLVARGCRRIVYGAPYSSSTPEEIAARTLVLLHHGVAMVHLPLMIGGRSTGQAVPVQAPPIKAALGLLPRGNSRACYVFWDGAEHAVCPGSFLFLLRLAREGAKGVRAPLGAAGRKVVERLRRDLARLPGGDRYWVLSMAGGDGRYVWAAGAPPITYFSAPMLKHPWKPVQQVLRGR